VERVGTSCRVPPVRGPGASQMIDEHPWGTTSHAAAIAFLPASVGKLLYDDRLAHGHDLVGKSAVQALAVGGQFAFSGGFTSPAGLVAPALLPPGSAFTALLRPAPLVVVRHRLAARLCRSILRWRRRMARASGRSSAHSGSKRASACCGTMAILEGPRSRPMVSVPTVCFGL
jgi:hypothetical protein